MGEYKIAVVAGDGIGPEITAEAVKVLEVVGEKFGHKFIFDEVYKHQLGNERAVEEIKKHNGNGLITADSAEPRSIASFKNLGLKIIGAKKGPDSIEHGLYFLFLKFNENGIQQLTKNPNHDIIK